MTLAGTANRALALRNVVISVVIPAHNSSEMIEGTVMKLATRLADRDAEIIVVENGSKDDTYARCERLIEQWGPGSVSLCVIQSERGMGNALRAGILASQGASVLLTADDLPFGFDDLDAADRIAAGAESELPPIIIGSKAHRESDVARGPGRTVLAAGFAWLRKLILRTSVGDSQGTILVDGKLIRTLAEELKESGFLFSTELVYVVERMGIRPTEVPVRLSQQHGEHLSRVSTADVARMAVGLLRLRARHAHPVGASVKRSLHSAR